MQISNVFFLIPSAKLFGIMVYVAIKNMDYVPYDLRKMKISKTQFLFILFLFLLAQRTYCYGGCCDLAQ